ncbi:MAG TPA: V-type ATP synthase subunit D [Nitrospiria bacterium]|nr:V-type ATP synthase subunit D [Nitrospiria bacterium]
MERASPTRMHLLLLRQRVLVAQKGLDLLESKREALVREFFTMVGSALTARENLRRGMQQAQNALTLAIGIMGRETLASAAFATRRDLAIELVERNIWGVRFPDLHYQTAIRALDARGYAITGTTPHLDETARRFEEVLDLVLKTVSVEMKLKRIGQEIKKVTRRINALKELILPPLRLQIREIKNSLEEREHEDIFRIKRFKGKRSGSA